MDREFDPLYMCFSLMGGGGYPAYSLNPDPSRRNFFWRPASARRVGLPTPAVVATGDVVRPTYLPNPDFLAAARAKVPDPAPGPRRIASPFAHDARAVFFPIVGCLVLTP